MSQDYAGSEHYPMHMSVNEEEDGNRRPSSWSNLGKDRPNVLILIFLYVLQGIPLGLSGSMPMILQGRKADYATQAFFSFAFWPFSVKLIWAPIVDSVFFEKFGRRKSWLVPVQYLIGIFLFVLSYNIKSLLGEDPNDPEQKSNIDIVKLTFTFISLCFLAATQDIAVDGWALTMLHKRNVGWASTCNTVGQTAGYFLGNIVFLALESLDFCNTYLRFTPQPYGVVTIDSFMYYWAWVFIISTTLTALFIKEKPEATDDSPDGVLDTYKMLYKIVKLPAVVRYCVILLTAKMAFAATDAVASLKLIDSGVPKVKLAMLGVPMVPIQILLPLIISKYTGGAKPLDIFMKAYPFRVLMGLVIAGVVYITPSFKLEDGEYPVYYYVMLVCLYALHQVALYCMYVSVMAFTAKVSDPAVGGTYMTLLNTITNLGGNWPATSALYLVSRLDIMSTLEDGSTVKSIDGFYIETAICTVIGVAWVLYFKSKINHMQRLSHHAWKVK